MLERLQQNWAILAQISAWLAGLVGVFLIEPPKLAPNDVQTGTWLQLSQFLVAIMVGLFFVRPSPTRLTPWRTIALSAAVAGIVLFFVYQVLTPSWTCLYVRERVVTGDSLSQLGIDFRATHPGAPCWLMIGAALGTTTDLWPKEELLQRYIVLCAVYTAAVLCFSASVMATIHHVQRSTEGRSGGKDQP